MSVEKNFAKLLKGIALCSLLVIAISSFQSCAITKHLQDDELLLNSNEIKFENKKELSRKERAALSIGLEQSQAQKPNSKFLFLFPSRLWFYYQSSQGDTTEFKQWVNKRLSEPPADYSNQSVEQTVESMQYYLQNKGYFDAQVRAKQDTSSKKKRVNVEYIINTNQLYTVDSIGYYSADKHIETILKSIDSESLLKGDAAVSNVNFTNEKNRITTHLKNLGYYYFYPNYITFLGDTTGVKTSVTVQAGQPQDTSKHIPYRISHVYIFPKLGSAQPNPSVVYDTIPSSKEGYSFVVEQGQEIGIREDVLLKNIPLRSNAFYSLKEERATVNALGKMGMYRFVKTRFDKDFSKSGAWISANVFLSPAKKQEIGVDLELNTGTNAAIGSGVGVSYRNRNFFNGAEIFSLNMEGGVETAFGANDTSRVIRALDLKLSSQLLFPSFVFPFNKRLFGLNKPRTTVSLTYNYLRRFEFYNYSSLTLKAGYIYSKNNTITHEWNPVSIEYLRPTTFARFNSILANNEFLRRSFDNQLFVGSDYSFTVNKTLNFEGESMFFKTFVATSGNFLKAADNVINPNNDFSLFSDTEYSQFALLDVDLRYYNKSFSRNVTLAARINSGIGISYGHSVNEPLPYVKQFYVGGATSIRAWRIRELGPGSFVDLSYDGIPYQTGNFKLQASAEMRFNMGAWVEGAFFVDAGNIWLLKPDPDRPNAELSNQFFKQIAIGSGFGLRLDFSYFIIRLDLAYKLRNPFPDGDGNYANYTSFNQLKFSDTVYNLAIGYPF